MIKSASNKLLLQFFKQYPLLTISNIAFSFSGALFNGVSTALVIPVLLAILGEELVFDGMPPLLKNIFAFLDSLGQERKIFVMVGAILLAITLKNLNNYFTALISGYLNRSLANDLRQRAIKNVLEVDIDFFAKHKIGYIISHINQETGRATSAFRTLLGMISTIITIIIFLSFLIALSWQLTIITTGLLMILALTNQWFIKKSKQLGRQMSIFSRQMSNSMLEMLGGIRLIKITANEEQEYKKIQRLIEEREKAQFNGQLISSLISPLNEISGIILVISIVVFGRILFEQQLQSDNVSGLLLTYLVILFRLLPFVGSLNGKRSQFASASTGLEITADFLRRDNKPYMPDGKKIYTQLSQSIDLLDVSFSYPKHNDLVLKGITLSIPKGKTVALVGSSGAGKSTIADLVPRFYDVTGGQITIDGIDIKEYNIASLRRAMGVVSQDTFLFSNTIRYNIAYGLEDVSESDIIMAAKRANAYEFIQKLAKGLDTEVGDRGIMLSGGQKQRIAIARALLRNPDILILDEATSALDTVSEKLVQQAIEELCKDRTTLVIAHRLSTVRNADKIVVLEQGKVVETGTHEELLALNGYYAKLNAMQFAKVKSDTTEFMAAENLT